MRRSETTERSLRTPSSDGRISCGSNFPTSLRWCWRSRASLIPTLSHQPLVGYWEFLALADRRSLRHQKWPETNGKEERWRLIWTQALHWAAVLVAMNIMLVSGVQQLLPTPATSLVLLTLLALGTFLAGVSLLSLQIAFLGVAIGNYGPAISWLQQSIIFFLLAAVLLIGLGITFWLRQDRVRDPRPPYRKTKRRLKCEGPCLSQASAHPRSSGAAIASRCRPDVQGRQAAVRQSPRVGLVLGSAQELRCVFAASRPPRQYVYDGRIRRIGLDLGVTSAGSLSWAVFARNSRIGPGTLRGSYVGASGSVALGPGLGANMLDRRLPPKHHPSAPLDRTLDRIEPCGGRYQSHARPARRR